MKIPHLSLLFEPYTCQTLGTDFLKICSRSASLWSFLDISSIRQSVGPSLVLTFALLRFKGYETAMHHTLKAGASVGVCSFFFFGMSLGMLGCSFVLLSYFFGDAFDVQKRCFCGKLGEIPPEQAAGLENHSEVQAVPVTEAGSRLWLSDDTGLYSVLFAGQGYTTFVRLWFIDLFSICQQLVWKQHFWSIAPRSLLFPAR